MAAGLIGAEWVDNRKRQWGDTTAVFTWTLYDKAGRGVSQINPWQRDRMSKAQLDAWAERVLRVKPVDWIEGVVDIKQVAIDPRVYAMTPRHQPIR